MENIAGPRSMDAKWEDAIRRGRLRDVLDLLGRGIDVNARDRHGQTGLMLAAHAGHRQVVEALIAHRAKLNTTAKHGLSALMLAIVGGHAEVARLLADAGSDLSLRGSGAPGFTGKTAWDLAVERDMLELSSALKPRPHVADNTIAVDDERCREWETFRKIDAAFRSGELEALRAALGDPACVPNGPMPQTIGPCLVYAIYHSPLPFIRTLLALGADPNPAVDDGLPPLIAALSCSRPQQASPGRSDGLDVIKLLLECGADPNQRGINDYTPLHMAVSKRQLPAVAALLAAGADPRLRTRIDDFETPLEMARKAGLVAIARLLAAHESPLGD